MENAKGKQVKPFDFVIMKAYRVEAMTALCLLDMMFESMTSKMEDVVEFFK